MRSASAVSDRPVRQALEATKVLFICGGHVRSQMQAWSVIEFSLPTQFAGQTGICLC